MDYQKFLEKTLGDTVEKTQGERPGARREREIHFGKMKFVYWRDYPNDCWVLRLPNGEVLDFSFLSGVYESAHYYVNNH